MPSLDIVSEINSAELKNAVDNSTRELETRFDFRNVKASFEFKNNSVNIGAEHDSQLIQLVDMLRKNLIKRGIEASTIDAGKVEYSGKECSQKIAFKEGVDQLTAKKIVKLVKESKIKGQIAIQGEQLRVTGKKRDDLQSVMSLIKSADLGYPFQFNNFRD